MTRISFALLPDAQKKKQMQKREKKVHIVYINTVEIAEKKRIPQTTWFA